MSNYRIVASDLDGTLFTTKGKVSKENEEAIRALTERGVLFVPSSGRALYEIPSMVRDNPYVRYIIHSDGAAVYDKQTGECLDASMPRELAVELLDILSEYDVSMTVRNQGKSYTAAKWYNDEAGDYYRVPKSYQQFIYRYSVSVEDFDSFCRALDSVEMICVFFHRQEELEACRERLLGIPRFGVAASHPTNIEVFDARAGKGEALLRLAEHLGIDAAQTVGVGDSPNDRNMIERAGLGLAMANADEGLKEIADAVACHNDEHVVSYILNRYIVE